MASGDEALAAGLEIDLGHVHQYGLVQAIGDPGLRERTYRSFVGRWGDSNDAALVHLHHPLTPAADGTVFMTKELAETIFSQTRKLFQSDPIHVLKQSTFARLSTSPKGIFVDRKSNFFDVGQNADMLDAFKYLAFGLRVGRKGPKDRWGRPIPMIGIEARNTKSANASLNALPKKIPGKPEIDLKALFEHDSTELRGLVSASADLMKRALRTGTDPRIVR